MKLNKLLKYKFVKIKSIEIFLNHGMLTIIII